MQTEMTSRPENLADFERPPLDEVAIAVQFKELPKFESVHYGLLFEQFKKDFPAFEDNVPLSVRFETFGRSGDQVRPMEFPDKPPLRRCWFIGEDGHRLIQVQPNRFVYNWRKVSGKGDYPRFEKMLPNFITEFEKFQEFLMNFELGAAEPNQYELSYFNNIEIPEEESQSAAFSRIFSTWNDKSSTESLSLSIIEPETPNFSMRSRVLAMSDKQPIGRLYVEATPATNIVSGKELIRLTIIFRGPPTAGGIEGLEEFFLVGREAIVDKFASITSDKCHEEWGRF